MNQDPTRCGILTDLEPRFTDILTRGSPTLVASIGRRGLGLFIIEEK